MRGGQQRNYRNNNGPQNFTERSGGAQRNFNNNLSSSNAMSGGYNGEAPKRDLQRYNDYGTNPGGYSNNRYGPGRGGVRFGGNRGGMISGGSNYRSNYQGANSRFNNGGNFRSQARGTSSGYQAKPNNADNDLPRTNAGDNNADAQE